jgi:hypothetical protein
VFGFFADCVGEIDGFLIDEQFFEGERHVWFGRLERRE